VQEKIGTAKKGNNKPKSCSFCHIATVPSHNHSSCPTMISIGFHEKDLLALAMRISDKNAFQLSTPTFCTSKKYLPLWYLPSQLEWSKTPSCEGENLW
jgi:hypothetical protein